ncbi:MAG: hypothetical protein QW112_01040, partial [Candidatus Micrarchaeia archaeon]
MRKAIDRKRPVVKIIEDILERNRQFKAEKSARPPKIRKWVWETSRNIYLAYAWGALVAWHSLPQWLCKPVTVVYTAKKDCVVDMYYDETEMNASSKMIVEKVMSDRSALDRIVSDCKIEHDKLVQVAVDLDELNYRRLPEETLYKIYDIF